MHFKFRHAHYEIKLGKIFDANTSIRVDGVVLLRSMQYNSKYYHDY